MRTALLFVAMILLAQVSLGQAVDNTITKVDNTVNQVNKASETFGKLKGLLPKKKAKAVPVDSLGKAKASDSINITVAGVSSTVIKVTGIDFSTLKKLYTNIQTCEGVKEAKMKFGADSSSIEIKHTGTTEDLLTLIQLTSKDIFVDENIVALEPGLVALKLK